MNDYNDGIIPEPCLRLDYGFGQEYASVELGDGTGYVRVTDELRGEYHKMQRRYEDVLKAALDENAKLREYLAASIPLPLDGNRSAIHPDDVIGNNVGGTDFFRRVTEMYLTRYPRDGQPALWIVRTEDDDGNVFPYVCWGGRCNVVHKEATQTYSAEYLETYDENKQLKAENAKLRELLAEDNEELAKMRMAIDYLYSFAKACGVDAEDMRELVVEVDG